MRNWSYYTFIVKERPDGTPWVGVATPEDLQVADAPSSAPAPATERLGERLGDASVALRLNLCATYADAREIADFLNRKLHILNVSRPAAVAC